jgi:ribosome-associated protein
MKKNDLKNQINSAIQACLDKKAEELTILEMEKGSGAFTDYFVLCSASNPRQVQAIADEVEMRLKSAGLRPAHVEGYKQAEWVLVDYVDFVVHVFSEKARKFYDLERLWKSARKLEPSELNSAPKKRKAAAAATPRKSAGPKSAGSKSIGSKSAGSKLAGSKSVPLKSGSPKPSARKKKKA